MPELKRKAPNSKCVQNVKENVSGCGFFSSVECFFFNFSLLPVNLRFNFLENIKMKEKNALISSAIWGNTHFGFISLRNFFINIRQNVFHGG